MKGTSIVLALVLGLVFVFLATGLFDLLYVRYLVGQFQDGLADVDFANPHLGKALVSAVSATTAFLYLRYGASGPRFATRPIGFATTTAFAVTALVHLVAGASTWGHYFDGLGNSLLRYEITYDNQVVLYSNHTVSPRTGRPLAEVTPAIVHELEMRRRRGSFAEVTHPTAEQWFGSGNAAPLLWYSDRDGVVHLFNMSGYDPLTARKLEPVTLQIQKRFYEQEGERERRAAKEAEEKGRVATLAAENGRLQEELRVEHLVQTAATPIPMQKLQRPPARIARKGTEAPNILPNDGGFNLLEAIIGNLDRSSRGEDRANPPYCSLCGRRHWQSERCVAAGLRQPPILSARPGYARESYEFKDLKVFGGR